MCSLSLFFLKCILVKEFLSTESDISNSHTRGFLKNVYDHYKAHIRMEEEEKKEEHRNSRKKKEKNYNCVTKCSLKSIQEFNIKE